jgi:hypothetical protein
MYVKIASQSYIEALGNQTRRPGSNSCAAFSVVREKAVFMRTIPPEKPWDAPSATFFL